MVAPVVALAFPASQARQEVADVVELRVFGSKLDVIASLLFQHMHHNRSPVLPSIAVDATRTSKVLPGSAREGTSPYGVGVVVVGRKLVLELTWGRRLVVIFFLPDIEALGRS